MIGYYYALAFASFRRTLLLAARELRSHVLRA